MAKLRRQINSARRKKAPTQVEPVPTPPLSTDPDVLVPDPLVQAEFNINAMSLYRWDRDPRMIALGWPPRIKIRQRNFRSRKGLEAFKRNLNQQALERRADTLAKTERKAVR